ncbi:protein EMBRYO SAC DEVELOPMENT ARREST 30-like isoform X2 [Malus sylvestris]|uniref:protein EMBRYO SAC DEVELOPMENT ARREST 30-like isoform X2 n=1 Tax=Malus sylvestris TaxID=3752 RepID=UPI0021ABCB64|nr:protein EMBRYO SAC DEVELOPMENT ARREST 30-like isoform X2 [Malus sylvestris]
MLFKSKIKWVALFVLVLSFASLLRHISIARFSTVDLVQYSALTAFHNDFDSISGRQSVPNKKLWGPVKTLQSFQPYANPRGNYPVPNEQSNGFIYAKIFGGFGKIRSTASKCYSCHSRHSRKYSLKRHQSILPPNMAEFQRLRCRVAFHALQFRPEIQMLGHKMVERLRAWGQPFLAYHPGLVRETLAYHGCAELFQDVHTELIQYRRKQMIKKGIVHEELSIDSHLRRENGSCPLMPEEVGILLRSMGFSPKTIIYLAGSETFGGQRVLVPLRAMFPNLVDRTSLCSNNELADILGPETPLPQNPFHPPPAKSEEQLKEEWKKAGPRPRPLPPPPGRPIYQHEKEGWYGWITETDIEPDLSALDLRMQAHRLIWDALDYIVSVEADTFFPGFNNDGSGWPDFSSLVMGHRLYEVASSRTYRPDRKVVAQLFNMTRDNVYHPKHNWTLSVQEHLKKSLSEEGLTRQSVVSKPALFISHPLPECSCRMSSADAPVHVKGNDGRTVYGGEEECPKWMKHGQEVPLDSAGEEGVEDNELSQYGSTLDEQPESNDSDRTNATLYSDQDEEMDPND